MKRGKYIRARLMKPNVPSVLLLAAVGLLVVPTALQLAPKEWPFWESQVQQLSTNELEALARDLSVKVEVGESSASGTLIARENDSYVVLTNRHVLEVGDDYHVHTPDGLIYRAYPSYIIEGDYDLAVLVFRSNKPYTIATVADDTLTTLPSTEQAVLAAGFPFDSQELNFVRGTLEFVPEIPLEEGYHLGYSNPIEQGMSGGPILNKYGELIGINGMAAHPILIEYRFVDGTVPNSETQERMKGLSWGIPITALREASPILVNAMFPVEVPNGMLGVSQAKHRSDVIGNIAQTAEGITVHIEDDRGGQGSGVVVAREERTYYVVTAAHVVNPVRSRYTVVTVDGERYEESQSNIVRLEGIDLAVVTFRSRKTYPIATLLDRRMEANKNPQTVITGFVNEQPVMSFGLGFRVQRDTTFVQDNQVKIDSVQDDELTYTNLTKRGMSGGAVLDIGGRLIAVHRGADGNNLDGTLGYSFGVPIQTFLARLPETGIQRQWLKIESDAAPELPFSEWYRTLYLAIDFLEEPSEGSSLDEWLEYGNQLWRVTEFDKAVAAFDRVLEQAPRDDYRRITAWFGRGLAFSAMEKYPEAARSFQEAVEIDEGFGRGWHELGKALFKAQQYSEAVEALTTAIKYDRQNPDLYKLRADTFRNLTDYENAREDYTRAIEIKPTPGAYLYRSLTHSFQGENALQKTIDDLSKAIQINPNYRVAYVLRGFFYSLLNEWDQTLADANQALSLNSEDGLAYYLRGQSYLNSNQLDKAIENFTQAIQFEADFYLDEAYRGRGWAYFKGNQLPEAIDDFTQAIQLKPDNAPAYSGRGLAYFESNEWDKAISDLTQVLNLNGYDQDAQVITYTVRAGAYFNSNQWDKAIEDFTQVIALTPDDAEMYFNRGRAYTQSNQLERAMEDANRVIEINPDLVEAYLLRGAIYGDLNQLERAMEDANRVIELNPDFPGAYLLRGTIYFKFREWDRARQDLQEAERRSCDQGNEEECAASRYLLQQL